MKSFGSNLRYYRHLTKISQQKLGDLLGFSARTISDWECNNTEPDLKTLKNIAKVLNVTIDELLDF